MRRRRVVSTDEKSLGAIVGQIVEAREIMRKDGASATEIAQVTERIVRERWPFERAWKYLCEACDDTGWIFGICTPDRACGRPFSLPGHRLNDYTGRGKCTPGHTYYRPCWCSKGQAIRAGLEKRNRPEDFTQAGKTSKPSGFSKFGRNG